MSALVAGAEVSDSVDFAAWRLRDRRFAHDAVAALRLRFPDPGDVYRFTVAAP